MGAGGEADVGGDAHGWAFVRRRCGFGIWRFGFGGRGMDGGRMMGFYGWGHG